MPTYRVTGPDGKTYQVTAPEGSTPEQALERVKKQASAPRDTAVGGVDALVRGAADTATFGLADKIAAAGNAVLPLDALMGRDVSSVWQGKGIADAFRENLGREQRIDQADSTVNPGMRLAGQVGGAVIGPVPGRALIAKGAARLGKSAPLARVVGEGAVQSGLYGLGSGDSTSVTERLDRGWRDALAGGAGAGLGYGLVRGGARAISPRVAPEIADLANAGVVMTPGQRGGRIARSIEQASESIPFVGAPIRAAKQRGVEQFNKAMVNEALSPIGLSAPKSLKAGEDTVAWAQDRVSDAFTKALSQINTPADDVFSQAMAGTAAKASKLPPAQSDAFKAVMENEITPLISGKQVLDGDTFQTVYRALQNRIARFDKGSDPLSDMTANALREVRDNFLSLAERNAGPGAKAFKAANSASANLARVNDAASRSQSTGGVFTPSTMMSAVSKKGYGTTTRNLARGEARMQGLADAAKKVLPDTLGNSGTADRAAWMAGLGAVGSGGAGVTVNPALALPAAGLLSYIPKVDAIMQRAALRGQSKLPSQLADEIRKRAYIGGMIGAPVAVQKRR